MYGLIVQSAIMRTAAAASTASCRALFEQGLAIRVAAPKPMRPARLCDLSGEGVGAVAAESAAAI
jgi:hypothetical protein